MHYKSRMERYTVKNKKSQEREKKKTKPALIVDIRSFVSAIAASIILDARVPSNVINLR